VRALAIAAAVLAVAVVSCDDGGDGNLLANPGFENGAAPWFALDAETWGAPFTVSDARATEGAASALLELRSGAGAEPERVFGAVQDVAPQAFPDVLSGSYYVERWERGTPLQYLQAVVIVEGAANAPTGLAAANHQLRYVLAGVDEAPLSIANARYVIVTGGDPVLGAWVDFELDLRDDFERLWGAVPEGFASVRVLLEVRWDGRDDGDPPSLADVYYDDLYLGPR